MCFHYVVFSLFVLDLIGPICVCMIGPRVITRRVLFVMNRMPASWDPFDPNALEAVDRDSDLGRELAILLEEQEQEENSDRLTVE